MKRKLPAATLSYFKENQPSEMEEVSIERPSEPIMAFVNAALELIGKAMARHSFVRMKTQVDATSVTLTYRREQQWIRVDASTDYRDSPAYFNLILGSDGPGSAMTVALWRVMRLVPGLEGAGEYAFPFGEGILPGLQQAILDLEMYGAGFLAGDLGKVRDAWERMLKEING